MIDYTVLANILNKDIMPTVQNQLYGRSLAWQLFGGFMADGEEGQFKETRVRDANQYPFVNNKMFVTIETGRVATNNITTGNNVTYGKVATDQGYLTPKITTGAFVMPKDVLNMKEAGAIVDKLTFAMNSTVNSMSMDLNRQVYGDGSATLAYVAASGSGTSVSIKPRATASTLYNGDISLNRYFPVGTRVKIGDNAITTVVSCTKDTLVVADSQTAVADTAIVKYDASDTACADLGGFGLMIGTGDYMGIDVTNDPTWVATVSTNSDTAQTMHNALTRLDSVFLDANETGNPTLLLMNKTPFQKYGQEFTSLVRFQYTDALGGGYKALEYMGGNAKIVLDYDCTDDAVFFLTPEKLFRNQLQPLQWEKGTDFGGQRITQRIDYEYIVDGMWEVGTTLRSAHGVARNIIG